MPAETAAVVDEMCTELWTAIATVSGGNYTAPPDDGDTGGDTNTTQASIPVSELSPATQGCVNALVVADANQDSLLATDEYNAFLNILGRNSFPLLFRKLDSSLQEIYNSRTEGTTVPVTGIESDPIPADLVTPLESFCTDVWQALETVSGGDITTPETLEDLVTTPPVAIVDLSPATQTCVNALIAADTSGDESLGTDEYTVFVNILGSNIFPKTFRYLHPSLLEVFEARRDVNVIHVDGIASDPIFDEDAAELETLCAEVWTALGEASGGVINPPTEMEVDVANCPILTEISEQQMSSCKYAMVAEDMNRDNLLSEFEWLGFVNRMTGNAYGSLTSFDDLPEIFQETFLQLGGTAQAVNVTGSKPNAVPTEADLIRIQYICSQIYQDIECVKVVVSDAVDGGSGNSTDGNITSDELTSCVVSMAISDLSRDEQMDQIEYIRFLNRLSSNE